MLNYVYRIEEVLLLILKVFCHFVSLNLPILDFL